MLYYETFEAFLQHRKMLTNIMTEKYIIEKSI